MEPAAVKHNVRIDIENLFRYDDQSHLPVETTLRTAQEMKCFLEELGECFGACVDTGHAMINGIAPSEFIHVLNERVAVIHVHDNRRSMDTHDLPYNGLIDWPDFVRALKDVQFNGVFSLELHGMALPRERKYYPIKKQEIQLALNLCIMMLQKHL